MIKSNQAVVPVSAFKGSMGVDQTIADNFATLDNQKMKRQVMGVNKARMNGSQENATIAASKLRLQSSASASAIRPLIRKKEARDYV